jgi:hypothetical protein
MMENSRPRATIMMGMTSFMLFNCHNHENGAKKFDSRP